MVAGGMAGLKIAAKPTYLGCSSFAFSGVNVDSNYSVLTASRG